MGGYGSGSWYRWNKKTTTESQHRIDIRWMKKHGRLKDDTYGCLSWTFRGQQSGSIRYIMRKDVMILNYRVRENGEDCKQVREEVSLDRTPCYYGGKRIWFLCPNCNRRVAVLYGAGRYFLCRHCSGLTYHSQQQPPHFRLMEKAQAIKKRLGGDGDLSLPLPPKPKHMHAKTYRRLCSEYEAASASCYNLAAQKFGANFC